MFVHLFLYFMLTALSGALRAGVNPLSGKHLRVLAMEVRSSISYTIIASAIV